MSYDFKWFHMYLSTVTYIETNSSSNYCEDIIYNHIISWLNHINHTSYVQLSYIYCLYIPSSIHLPSSIFPSIPPALGDALASAFGEALGAPLGEALGAALGEALGHVTPFPIGKYERIVVFQPNHPFLPGDKMAIFVNFSKGVFFFRLIFLDELSKGSSI